MGSAFVISECTALNVNEGGVDMCSKAKIIQAITAVIVSIFLMPLASAEEYQFSRCDENWKVTGYLLAPKSFQENLYQYQYVQQNANVEELNEKIKMVYSETMVLNQDRENSSHVYTGKTMMLSIPTFISQELYTIDGHMVINQFLDFLNDCRFSSDVQPYLCATLDTLRHEMNNSAIGRILDWASYQYVICNENQDLQLQPEDIVAVFAPSISDYPILPQLYGNYKDNAIPMFALIIIHNNTVRYIEIGCSYDVKREKLIETKPIDWKAAVDEAINYCEHQWRQAFDSMATIQVEGLDYAAFYATYHPSFEIKAEQIRACYYGKDNILSPAFQINLTLSVYLENDDNLTITERHRFMPEEIRCSYVIDAITGEIVR